MILDCLETRMNVEGVLFGIIRCFVAMVLLCFVSCSQEKVMEDVALLSPSGTFSAEKEEINENGVNCFQVIVDKSLKEYYRTKTIYRKRDAFLMSWSDERDVLWCYSGDVGLLYYDMSKQPVVEDYFVLGKHSKEAIPQKIREYRPSLFK